MIFTVSVYLSILINKKSRRTVDTNCPQTNKNMESCTVKKSTRSLSSTQHTDEHKKCCDPHMYKTFPKIVGY